MIKVIAFGDQDADRAELTRLAERETVSLLMLMDLVTSDGGGLQRLQDAAPNSESVDSYLQFRAFYGPHIRQTLLGMVGRVLQAASVDRDGRVWVDPHGLTSIETQALDELTGLAGRLNWIAGELPSLQAQYGQLYEHEADEAERLATEIDDLDVGNDIGWARAQEIWPRAEELYQFAQPGARLMRGDDEAVADAERLADEIRQRLADESKARMRRLAIAHGEDYKPEERQGAIEECKIALSQAKAARAKAQAAAEEAERAIGKLSQRLTELHLGG